MRDRRDTIPIPHPKRWPLVGNVTSIDVHNPLQSLGNLAARYGEIFSLTILGSSTVVVASQRLTAEVCDEKRFKKVVKDELGELRHLAHDGLFTAHTEELNWELAHRILVPALGPMKVENMFDEMKDIASQLILKWARHGPDHSIAITDDFTRLTMDTIALCAMDYRFNSFYTESTHPFLKNMVDVLIIAGERPYRLLPNPSRDRKFFGGIKAMRELADSIVRQRKEDVEKRDKKDLLNTMIYGKDPKTGQTLPHDNIIDNMITFLVAGHETTSGLLSFAFYFLVKSPEAYQKAQDEVDAVVGNETISLKHLSKLHYIQALLRETLRLQPTAPAFTVGPVQKGGDTVGGGDYFVNENETIVVLLPQLHRDPAVYGNDAEEFKPERMLDENFNKLPPHSWKPFGNGRRSCIGRPLAWQEAVIVTTMILQYFNISLVDPSYNLQVKATLTIKPKDLFLRATLREGWTPQSVEQSLASSIQGAEPPAQKTAQEGEEVAVPEHADHKSFQVFYGTNTGTCESFARTLASNAAAHGFKASKVDTLDAAKRKIQKGEPVVIITASYEGEPCDNAKMFFHWLESLTPTEQQAIEGCNFAVFGCGHSDWAKTFHRIPKVIDELLEKYGGNRICARGSADAAQSGLAQTFQDWEDGVFWPAMRSQFHSGNDVLTQGPSSSLTVEISTTHRASRLRTDVHSAKVLSTRTLTSPDAPEKRHIELQLPSDMSFRAGDYLAILPLNPPETVHRVMVRFGLPWDAMLTISSTNDSTTSLPTEGPVSAQDLFSAFVELSQTATKRDVVALLSCIDEKSGSEAREALQKLVDNKETFQADIVKKEVSLLDLLETYPAIDFPIAYFIGALISMRVRQYSISASPLADPHQLSLTYAILNEPSHSGAGQHIGVASNYLARLREGDTVHVGVKPSNRAFHLPVDAEATPLIMVCAGSGLAPFRGFVQERFLQIQVGRKLAPAHLYVGCRHPDKDALYRAELATWEEAGAVTMHYAFSQAPDRSGGHKHVDELLRADVDLLLDLWQQGARIYVCGSSGLGESVKQACLHLHMEGQRCTGGDDSLEAAEKWLDGVKGGERYSTDVFA